MVIVILYIYKKKKCNNDLLIIDALICPQHKNIMTSLSTIYR